MEQRLTGQITTYLIASAPLLAAAAYLVGGKAMALGAIVGGVVALLNWLVLRWVIRRIIDGSQRGKAFMMLTLVAKMGGLMALCWLLIARLDVDAVGFALGLGSLVVGITLGSGRAIAGGNLVEEG